MLDPFCGSGTTLCVANELGIHAVGVEISCFNAMLSNAKIRKYNNVKLKKYIDKLTKLLETKQGRVLEFEKQLNEALSDFNQAHFPSKSFKRKVTLGQIDEKAYSAAKEKEFLIIYERLIKNFKIKLHTKTAAKTQIKTQGNFFEKWYIDSIKDEILLLKKQIEKAPKDLQDILMIILSRTARSCRATTHSDLATLKKPMLESYYCRKHGRICKPLFSILKWWKSYANDTLKRLQEFQTLRSEAFSLCLNADSKNVDIVGEISKHNATFTKLLKQQKIAGIFSSPPYVGLIDYHEQHAYAYDIFALQRKDERLEGSKMGRVRQHKRNIFKI